MIANLIGCLRTPPCREIGRTCAHHGTNRPDPCCDHAAFGQAADPNRDVDVFLDRIDDAIGEQKSQADIGEQTQELDRQRQQMRVSQAPRCRNDEIALGTSILAGNLSFSVIDLFDDPPAGLDIVSASIGQRHPP